MREILFRGKDADTGFWCFGDLSFDKEKNTFIRMWTHNGYAVRKVVPETVCQYTGQTDRDRKKIYEGDLVFVDTYGISADEGAGIIFWDNEEAMYEIRFSDLTVGFQSIYGYECEVVGNKWDNPELLEV